MSQPLVPVYVYTKDTQLPAQGTYYIVARNGTYLRKDTGLVKATVKVDGIACLEPVPIEASIRLPQLSPELSIGALRFFRQVYRIYQTEAELTLHYNSDERVYRLDCPPQEVTTGSVHSDISHRFPGFQLVGTFHSHAKMSAFHSTIDHHSEQHFDGLHITYGCLDQPYFTISCSIMVNGQRFYIAPDKTVQGLKPVDYQPQLQTVYRRKEVPRLLDNPFSLSWLDFDFSPQALVKPANEQYYEIVLPEGKDYRHVGYPLSWLDRVKPVHQGFGMPFNQSSTQQTPNHSAAKKQPTYASQNWR